MEFCILSVNPDRNFATARICDTDEIVQVFDPTGCFLDAPESDLVGQTGTAYIMLGTWLITSIMATEQACS